MGFFIVVFWPKNSYTESIFINVHIVMVTPDLVRFIKERLAKGTTRDAVASQLKSEGWSDADISDGFVQAASGVIPASSQGLPPVGELFSKAWALYRSRFKTLLLLTVIATIVTPIVNLILLGIGFSAGLANILVGSATKTVGLTTGTVIAGIIIAIVGGILSGILTIMSNAASVLALAGNGQEGASALLRRAYGMVWAIVGAGILAGLVTFGGTALFVIPGIIVGVGLLFTTMVVVLENRRGLAALRRSMALVNPRWFGVFGRDLLLALVVWIVTAIATSILSFILRGTVANIIVAFAVTTLITPFSFAYFYLLFQGARSVAGETSGAEQKQNTWIKVLLIVGVITIIILPTYAIVSILGAVK